MKRDEHITFGDNGIQWIEEDEALRRYEESFAATPAQQWIELAMLNRMPPASAIKRARKSVDRTITEEQWQWLKENTTTDYLLTRKGGKLIVQTAAEREADKREADKREADKREADKR